MKVKIDALDVTVLKGGAADIGAWAKDHGFRLPPDAPEVLDFYARRSPIFLAAAFDADAAAARGQQIGDGTPVHITIPTDNPWVPLRILALGKTGEERVEADVYLLTDHAPALLPVPTGDNGIRLDHSAAASTSLLDDLRSDRGMEWIPAGAWLTEGRRRLVGGGPVLRPRDRRQRGERAVAGRRGPGPAGARRQAAATVDDGGAGIVPARLLLALMVSVAGIIGILALTRYQPGRRDPARPADVARARSPCRSASASSPCSARRRWCCAAASEPEPIVVDIAIHYSHFEPADDRACRPAGR